MMAPPLSVAGHIEEQLRSAIYDGTLAPGERLIERELAQQFQVSHIPVREALARLAEEGLVEHFPRRGARVAQIDDHTLGEVEDIRIQLELLVVARVQERWTPEAERELRSMVDEMVVRAKAREADEVFRIDRDFHTRLWELSDHGILMELAGLLRSRINRFLLAAYRAMSTNALRQQAVSHRVLLDAIATGEVRTAQNAMRQHIDVAASRMVARTPRDRSPRP
jgi:DNA-binding GntR family transcriptional regulator